MNWFSNLFKNSFDEWLETASKEELSEEYECERQIWIKNGYNGVTGRRTDKMERINKEISRRVAKEWENNPKRNRDPNYRWTDANRWDRD